MKNTYSAIKKNYFTSKIFNKYSKIIFNIYLNTKHHFRKIQIHKTVFKKHKIPNNLSKTIHTKPLKKKNYLQIYPSKKKFNLLLKKTIYVLKKIFLKFSISNFCFHILLTISQLKGNKSF